MKKDNRGISLIELLVAVAMLAVVMTPMLNSFMLSGRNNYESRNLLRATTVANNVMESLEAFSLEEICEQFNTKGNFKLYPQQPAKQVGEEGTVRMEYKEVGNGTEISGEFIQKDDGTRQYIYKPTSDNKYHFVMKNIQEDGNYYDAKITLDASKYRAQSANPTDEEKKKHYNEHYTINVDLMDTKKDAVFICTMEEEKVVFEDIQNKYSLTMEKIAQEAKRTLNVSFTKNNDNSMNVRLDVGYIFRDYSRSLPTKSAELSELRNVYIMFYPNYNSTGSKVLDEITIETDNDEEFNLLLVKQLINDYYFNIYYKGKTLQLLDEAYKANITIKDNSVTMSEVDNSFVSNIQFRTNLTGKITDDNSEKSLDEFTMSYYVGDNLLCSYPAKVNEIADIRNVLQFVNNLPQNLAGEKQNNNLMYETIVEIYPQGSYDADEMTEENRMVILNRK